MLLVVILISFQISSADLLSLSILIELDNKNKQLLDMDIKSQMVRFIIYFIEVELFYQKYDKMKKLINFITSSPKMQEKKEEQFILMTYRSNIQAILSTTYYNTDSGWGCMLRVGQMAIANYLHLHQRIPLPVITSIFMDNSDNPFSIQQFTVSTNKMYPHKKQYEWYNPCEMAFIIKDLIEPQFPYINVKVFPDNSLFLQEIPTNQPKLLVIILIRIGLEEPQHIYLPTVDSLMNNPYFFSALGGTPKHAHLFLKSKNNQIGYLDPHKTLKAAANEEELLGRQSEYLSELSWIKNTKIDSSMGLVFKIKKEEIQDFWLSFEELKKRHKQNFFIYMDKTRPQLQQGGIIEIDDFQ